jgi:hypothetical protein
LAVTETWKDGIALWDVETGRPRQGLAGPNGFGRNLAYSADGRYLASGAGLILGGNPEDPPHDRSLRIYEVASGQEVLRWQLPAHTATCSLAFTPDSRTLLTGMSDSTVLVWDLLSAGRGDTQARAHADGEVRPDGLEPLWADLGHADAGRAHRALAALVTAGDRAVALLGRQLEPVPRPDPGAVARLVADLDSDRFAVREQAARELAKRAEAARPALERARAIASPETRRRIGELLGRLDSPVPPPEVLRAVRAVAVLEYVGTPEARRVLQGLEKGAPEARLTREARASLERLTRRATPAP